MNQSQNIFSGSFGSLQIGWPKIARLRWAAWVFSCVALSTLAVGKGAHAQEQISSRFQPPVQARQDNDLQFGISNSARPSQFPHDPVPFDPKVKPIQDANLQPASFSNEADERQSLSGANSLDMASMWNNFTTMIGAKWRESGASDSVKSIFGDVDIARILGSLALVLGGYFSLVGILRMFNLGGSSGVPTEVLELLGTVPLSPKKQLQIVRLGSKLLLIVDGEDGTNPIGEISDPEEVEYLASLCPGRKRAPRASAMRVRSASRGMAQRESVRESVAAVPEPAPVSTVAPTPQVTPTQNLGTNANHLAAILQSLNGPRTGNAAVFEG